MDKKTSRNTTYYVLAILGILLITVPFFFLDFTSQTLAATAMRLGLHGLAFGGAVITAGVAAPMVVKVIQQPGFAKMASWSVAGITATALTVATIQLSNSTSTISNIALQDSTATDSSAIAMVADSTMNQEADSIGATLADETEYVDETKVVETKQVEPKPSFTEAKKVAVTETKVKTTEPDKSSTTANCKDEDVGVFLSGQKVNLIEGFSFANKAKSIRIGDACGCTASGTKITVLEKNGKPKAEKTVTTPFFSLQSLTALDATDRVVAEVDQLKCINKEGISSLKKIKKLIFNIVFKSDGTETPIRKRAAKELQKTEEVVPVKKNAVEEEALKYGN